MNLKSAVFWIAIAGFFVGLLLAQNLLQRQGIGLLPGQGGNFTLQSNSGPVSLGDFKGKVVALYMGYMACPDICPTSLWNLAEAVRALSDEQAGEVQGIFVSVDPERDSPRALDIFARGFFPSFIGLTGNRSELDAVARQYGFVYEKVPLKDSAMGYVIDHSSVIYLVDRQGVLQAFIPHDTPPDEIRRQLLQLLS